MTDINIADIETFFVSNDRNKNDATNKIRERVLGGLRVIEQNGEYLTDPQYGEHWRTVSMEWNIMIHSVATKTMVPKYTSFHINLKGGRACHYDFEVIYYNGIIVVATRKLEFKSGCKNFNKLPQILQVPVVKFEILSEPYDRFYYEHFIDEYLQCDSDLVCPKPPIETYVKTIACINYNISEFISQLRINRKINKSAKEKIVHKSVDEYLKLYVPTLDEKGINLFADKIKETQHGKIFIFWHNSKFYIEEITESDYNDMKYSSCSENTIKIQSGITTYELRLRWKNSIGVLMPAWQIKMKRPDTKARAPRTRRQLPATEKPTISDDGRCSRCNGLFNTNYKRNKHINRKRSCNLDEITDIKEPTPVAAGESFPVVIEERYHVTFEELGINLEDYVKDDTATDVGNEDVTIINVGSETAINQTDVVSDRNFRELSRTFNSTLKKEIRFAQGIFFTPRKVRNILFAKLKELDVNPSVILEPSFGTGEFLLDAKSVYPAATLIGVEKNEELFNAFKSDADMYDGEVSPPIQLYNHDFLDWKGDSADLIIGNPPYFTMKLSGDSKSTFMTEYSSVMYGKPNIYVAFLYRCLTKCLTDSGHLAFIIPTSLYNSSYYQPMRNYIQQYTIIRYLETLDNPGFYETGQDTMLIILQKINDGMVAPPIGVAGLSDYIFVPPNGKIYLSPKYRELRELTSPTVSTTINQLGLGVKTGNVVWNQVKANMSDTGTLLIYASNIKNSELKIDNIKPGEKKQYVSKLSKPITNGPVLLVDRGYGNSYSFNSVFVEFIDGGFYAENHINVIYPKTPEAIPNLKVVMDSFKDPRSKQFIAYFIGNGAVSATDLETILPIFITSEYYCDSNQL